MASFDLTNDAWTEVVAAGNSNGQEITAQFGIAKIRIGSGDRVFRIGGNEMRSFTAPAGASVSARPDGPRVLLSTGDVSGADTDAPSAQGANIVSTTTGPAYTYQRLLGSSSTLALVAGSAANLTLNTTSGVISATSAIGVGVSQTATVRESLSGLAIEVPVTVTGVSATPTPTPTALKTYLAAHPTVEAAPADDIPTFSRGAANVRPFGAGSYTHYDITSPILKSLTLGRLVQTGTVSLNDGSNRPAMQARANFSGGRTAHCDVFMLNNFDRFAIPIATGALSYIEVWVNGKFARGDELADLGVQNFCANYTFPTLKDRVIEYRAYVDRISGIAVPTGGTISAAASQLPLVLGMTGDSYLTRFLTFAAADGLAAPNLFVDQIGGTGYIQVSGSLPDFTTRLNDYRATMASPQYDIHITTGGINDPSGLTIANVRDYYLGLRALQPTTLLIVVGPWSPIGADALNPASALSLKRDTILAALRQGGLGAWVFLDNLTGSWETSGGKTKTIATGPWITGDGRRTSFTAPLVAATSATLATAWTGASGAWTAEFSDGSSRSVTLTNGATSATWSGAVTATADVSIYRTDGNAKLYIRPDGVHPFEPDGANYLGAKIAAEARDAILA